MPTASPMRGATKKMNLPPEKLAANLWRYQAYQVLIFAFLFMPVIVLFWQDNGLDAFQIYLLQGLFAVSVVLLEVPTGMVADSLGKRASLVAAGAMLSGCFAFYSFGDSFWWFLVAEVVGATGAALASGADSALLYDTLARLDREDEFRCLEGNARALQMISIAVFTVLGGFVGEISFRATLWMSAVGPALAAVIALGMREAAAPRSETDGSYGQLIAQSVRFVARHRLVRWYVLFFGVLLGSATWLLWIYQPYMQHTGLPIYAFGLAFALFNLFAALASRKAQAVDDRLGLVGTLAALGALQVAPPVLMALVVTPASFLFILGHQAVRGISTPVIRDRILKYTFADKRATVLSLGSLTGRLFFAVTAPLIGWVTRTHTMSQTLLFQAALVLAVLALLAVSYRRIPDKYFHVKESVRQHQ